MTGPSTDLPLLRDDEVAFDALRDATAGRLGLPAGIVEKDYWATEVLRLAADPLIGADVFVFKGGTSLSKAYGIIERFSEDIDLLVVTALEGNARKRLLRVVADRPGAALRTGHVREQEGRGYLNARYLYPGRASVDLLSPGVLLELGCRGGPAPNERRTVESLMAGVADSVAPGSRADFSDLAAFETVVLAPHRTLAEKLAFLHHRAADGDLDGLRRGARHLYDVHRLLCHGPTRDALRGGAIVRIMVDVDERSRAAGWGFTPRPDGGFAVSPAFAGSGDVAEALRAGYSRIGPLIWGERPNFDRLLATVHEHATLL